MAALAGKRNFLPRHVPPIIRSTRARAAGLAGTALRRFDLPPNAKRAPVLSRPHLATVLAGSVL
ncbi:MAG: hypothetical protein JO158_04115 [Gammaproteobacteria bacterium]|nr:hypothetical protein [Gammaproteobacteria bacterium]MBV9726951.1 hypothetical protein [Gammaproteobacteria bacterium]